MNSESFYYKNEKYSNFLDNQKKGGFEKYVDYIIKYTRTTSAILDVGCGTGIALAMLQESDRRHSLGIDVSLTSVQKCQKKSVDCRVYDGLTMPFNSEHFDLVGSYNVLEHTDNPVRFLNEELRVLKKGGYLIIACPNFLSITNNFHQHTRGIFQKINNFLSLIKLFTHGDIVFEKMLTINRKNFQPDDDAVNVTNPISILKWAQLNKLTIKYWSSQSIYRRNILNYIDVSIFRLFLGSSLFIFKK